MASSSMVVKEINTQNGECKITLSIELNINLNKTELDTIIKCSPEVKKEETNFEIPKFTGEKIKFGK